VFQEPDSHELADQAEAYMALVGQATPFAIGKLRLRRPPHRSSSGIAFVGFPQALSTALILSLDGEWFSCRIRCTGRVLWIEDAAQEIRGGMSGSPVILPDGAAIGVICTSEQGKRAGGPNPLLSDCLPAWLLRAVWRASTSIP
jgi:hypothetical protein